MGEHRGSGRGAARRPYFPSLIRALWATTLLVCLPFTARAQGELGWSSSVQLGLLNADYQATFLNAAGDAFGNFHVVVPRNVSGWASTAYDGTIFYTRWDGRSWSVPIDIVAAPTGYSATAECVLATDSGALYLLWWADKLNLSSAPIAEATSAASWTTVTVQYGVHCADVVALDEGHLAIVYSDAQQDIFFQVTSDDGLTWSVPVLVWAVPSKRQGVRNVRLLHDGESVYHIVWTETDASLDWNPSGVWYARSLDGGKTWQDLRNLENEGSYINVALDSEKNVHLLWDHNVGSERSRGHMWSPDAGKTWSTPERIFPGLSGRTGHPQMLLDSSGTLHQITSGAGFGSPDRIYHSIWRNGRWTPLEGISAATVDSQGPAATIVEGNRLCVVWMDYEIKDVVFSWRDIDAPAVAAQAVPLFTPEPSSAHTESPPTTELGETPVTTETREAPFDDSQSDGSPFSQAKPIFTGSGAALVAVVAAVIAQRGRRPR